jgi:hypothetical protein
MNIVRTIVVALLVAPIALTAQAPQSNGKPTELVVVEYEKLVADGAFLTPEGWKKAGKLYEQSIAYPPNGEISLMGTGGNLGEDWVKGNEAQVETKWIDYDGTIDSALRFKPPEQDMRSIFMFRLVYTNKHRDIGSNGETRRELTGPWEWKLAEPQTKRVTTPVRAIEYLALMRDKTDDPLIRKHADKSIAALKRSAVCILPLMRHCSLLTAPEQSEALQCVVKSVTVHPQKLDLEIFELLEFLPGSQNRKEWLPGLDSN